MAFIAKNIGSSLNGDPADSVTSFNVINTLGSTMLIGTNTVTVRRLGNYGHVSECSSAVAPVNGDAGFSQGCMYVLTTNNGVGNTVYFNGGTATSAVWTTSSASPAGSASINSTGTATAAQVATGRIVSTSAAPTTITFPTGTLLGAALGATAGTVYELYIDNTAGASTVTMAVGVNAILSAAAAAGAGAGFGLLTVPSGATGVAQFTLMFSSSTAYVITRTA